MYGVLSRRSVAWGSLYGIRAAIYIYIFGGRLTPDSGLYASGRSALAWFSSPACSLAGLLFGWQGVCVVGIVGATALGSIVARNSHGTMAPAAVAILPPGWYAIQPASDAAASAACAWSYSRNWSRYHLALLAAIHVEAALVLLGSRILWRTLAIRGGSGALVMGALAQWHPTFHFQMRYFLPGLAMFAIERRTFSLRSFSFSRSLQSRWGCI